MANRLQLDFSISFYVGAIKRNKKGEETSHTLTMFLFFVYLFIILFLYLYL